MPVTRRRSRLPVDPVVPERFRSRDEWMEPEGLHRYRSALNAETEGSVSLVNALGSAGLSVADWYRKMFNAYTK